MADSVIFFRSFIEAIDGLDGKDQLAAYKAIARYGLDGEMPESNGAARAILIMAKPVLDEEKKSLDRNSRGYREWRDAVLKRDSYRCVRCGASGCRLEAHHIKQFAYFPELRLSVENGMTLCQTCHKEVHRR